MDCPDENTITAFIEGTSAAETRRSVEAHVDGCTACQALMAGLGRLLDPETSPGGGGEGTARVVGRYVLLGRLGAGGMGVVHLAYDPTLDRKIALKLIRAPVDDEEHRRASERLLREARAMARLSHPNIAAVYDAGRIDEQAFIAMELLEGGTLTEHLRQPRSGREVLAVFTAAGRGLEAAHRAGLVHRDFKPDNVLFAADGRVCVSDFGLVDVGPPLPEDGGAAGGGITRRTRGGTLGYMAPEQQTGRETDARGDQYSFCVALYRALHGEGPFAGDVEESLAAALANRVRPPPAGARLRARVRQALLRGLRADPAERWPDMDALLRALGDDPLGRGRRIAAAVAAAAIAGLGVMRLASPPAAVCRDETGALAGVWSADRRGRVERAFLATGQPFAAGTWERVAPALDAYASAWGAMATESCRATRVRGEQPDGIFSLRAVCLAQRRQELDALVAELETADRGVVESAVPAVAALTPVGSCADVAALGARVRPPADPAQRIEVDAVHADLMRVKALDDTAKYREGRAVVEEAVARARRTRHRPVVAEALLRRALLDEHLLDYRSADATLLDAIFDAEASGHDPVVAEAWTRLATLNVMQAQIPRAATCLPRAEAAIERMGGDAALSELYAHSRGFVLLGQGAVAEAGKVLYANLAAQEKRLGPDALELTSTLDELSRVEEALGNDAEVVELRERGLRIKERHLGPDHPHTGDVAYELGRALLEMGDLDRAERLADRSRAVGEATYGPDKVGGDLVLLGKIRDRKGQAEGLALMRRGIALHHVRYPSIHPAVALDSADLADVLLRHGQLGEAREAATAARRAWEIMTPGQFQPAACATLLGRIELAQGAAERAIAALEPAVAYYERSPGTPAAGASSRFALARALHETGKDRARAHRLAEAALAIPPGPSPERAREHEAIAAWLSAHPLD